VNCNGVPQSTMTMRWRSYNGLEAAGHGAVLSSSSHHTKQIHRTDRLSERYAVVRERQEIDLRPTIHVNMKYKDVTCPIDNSDPTTHHSPILSLLKPRAAARRAQGSSKATI
jgi:hypothetical protein